MQQITAITTIIVIIGVVISTIQRLMDPMGPYNVLTHKAGWGRGLPPHLMC